MRTSPRRLLADRAGSLLVRAGGAVIVLSILGILVFILIEVRPLLSGARVTREARFAAVGAVPGAVITDEHRSLLAAMGADGILHVLDAEDGNEVESFQPIPEGPAARPLRVERPPGDPLMAALAPDGTLYVVPVEFQVSFVDGKRRVAAEPGTVASFALAPSGPPPRVFTVRLDEEGGAAAAQLEDGTLVVVTRMVEENLFTGEVSASSTRETAPSDIRVSALVMDHQRRFLYGATAGGSLVVWPLEDGTPGVPRVTRAGDAGVTALTLLKGDRALVAGGRDGSLAVWFPLRDEQGTFRLSHVRDFPPMDGAVRILDPSPRNKGFLAADEAGGMGLYYSTSDRTLWRGKSPVERPTALCYAPKADGAVLAGPGGFGLLAIRNPHPEVSLRALFGKIWYEGYAKPEYVWQSTGGTDDFEPKLSLVPLLVGSLKGTLYSLILAVPLGVLGAMYASQFMHPSLKRYVKPTVEVMAALPSVVLGFLAGLWLAPRLADVLPGFLLSLVVVPAAALAAAGAYRLLPAKLRAGLPEGSESLGAAVLMGAAIWGCIELSGPLSHLVFGGSFPAWLLKVTGIPYDQRNAVVVGLAMGFAVIPIIFSVAEDAFSNVPRSLISGSLALGATRWQTVTRVVLPTASPGIFSAIMIGFGRAVGETMIVLMATGNTPIMDWNPFNGFRTLSANIAVEIPEAPYGGTLYRTLFVSALLLFALTFVVNTAAELVRSHLRRRFGDL